MYSCRSGLAWASWALASMPAQPTLRFPGQRAAQLRLNPSPTLHIHSQTLQSLEAGAPGDIVHAAVLPTPMPNTHSSLAGPTCHMAHHETHTFCHSSMHNCSFRHKPRQ